MTSQEKCVTHAQAMLTRLNSPCTKCDGSGYYTGSEYGHNCDGSDRDCQMNCPIEVPVQVGCGCCSATGFIGHTPTLGDWLELMALNTDSSDNEILLNSEYLTFRTWTPERHPDTYARILFNLATGEPNTEKDWDTLAELLNL
jgi:hypothetical protein